jgi:hypothetical protein
MDSLQNQIKIITQKIDALYELTEQLSEKVNYLLAEPRMNSGAEQNQQSPVFNESLRSPSEPFSRLDNTLGHKDILLDSDYPNSEPHPGERELTPEVQIQRLTAQLTAAYGRMAALEEQLLSRRVL